MTDIDRGLFAIDELFIPADTAAEIFAKFPDETIKMCRKIHIVSTSDLDYVFGYTAEANRFQIRSLSEAGYYHLLRMRK